MNVTRFDTKSPIRFPRYRIPNRDLTPRIASHHMRAKDTVTGPAQSAASVSTQWLCCTFAGALSQSRARHARVSGKIFATSGSSRTTLVPSAYRAAVTPRTAFEKSYSERIVSSSESNARAFFLLFFILLSFISSCQPSANDSRTRRPLGVGNDQ